MRRWPITAVAGTTQPRSSPAPDPAFWFWASGQLTRSPSPVGNCQLGMLWHWTCSVSAGSRWGSWSPGSRRAVVFGSTHSLPQPISPATISPATKAVGSLSQIFAELQACQCSMATTHPRSRISRQKPECPLVLERLPDAAADSPLSTRQLDQTSGCAKIHNRKAILSYVNASLPQLTFCEVADFTSKTPAGTDGLGLRRSWHNNGNGCRGPFGLFSAFGGTRDEPCTATNFSRCTAGLQVGAVYAWGCVDSGPKSRSRHLFPRSIRHGPIYGRRRCPS